MTVWRQRLSRQRARPGIGGTGSGEHAEVVVVLAWVLGVEERWRPGSSAPIDGHGNGSKLHGCSALHGHGEVQMVAVALSRREGG